MKKAVIYARYSSERQTEQSIEGQLRVCNEFGKKNDIVIVDTYVDRAMTGTNDERPAFRKMIADAPKANWDFVLIYSIDRFGRNAIEISINKYALKKTGKTYISATQRTSDNIDGTKNLDGIILENLYIGLAEYYSAELSQKIRRGQHESRMKKQYTGEGLLYSYNIIDKKYVANNSEAEVINQVFTDYLNGKTAMSICKYLAERGIFNKRGQSFKPNAIYRMLRQEKYIGIVRHGDEVFDDTCPAIIDADLFERVQSIIQRNKRAPSKRKAYGKFILSGKLYCGDCGSLMTGDSGTGKSGKVHFYYKCAAKKRHSGCTFPSVQKDEIENFVFEACCNVLKGGFIPTIIDKAYSIQLEDAENDITIINLQEQFDAKKKALKNIMKAIEEGVITVTTKQRLEELEHDIDVISGKLENERIKQQKIAGKDDYNQFLQDFIKRQATDLNFKESIFDLLVRKVILFRDKIRITFNYIPDGKNDDSDTDIDKNIAEFAEAKDEYNNIETNKCSSLPPLPPP